MPVTRPGDAVEREAEAIAQTSLARGSIVPPGLDPSTVRIHTGAAASRAARALDADAYAIGDDVVLDGALETGTARGRGLLAHELAHVQQHRRRGGPPVVARQPTTVRATMMTPEDMRKIGLTQVQDAPKVTLPSREGRKVHVLDDDRAQTEVLPELSVVLSAQNVDQSLSNHVELKGDFWSLELRSMTVRYHNGSSLTIPWNELDFTRRPEASEWKRIHGVLYPLLDGRQTFDQTNTPNILLRAQLVLEAVTRAQRVRRVHAETVFSFTMAVAQLGGAVGPGEWLGEVAPRSTFRPLRPSEAPIDPLDAELEGSFRETFTEPDPELELSGPVVEPEISYGFTQAEVAGARRLVGRPIDGIGPIGRIWRRVTNPGEPGQLTLQNSRRLFDNQRGRFWRAVRQDAAARQMFEDAGFRFRGEATTAPVKELSNGETMQATIDHIVERQTDPTLALDPTNLRVSTRLENTVVLRQVTAQDRFQ